jgi:hypothetical protein
MHFLYIAVLVAIWCCLSEGKPLNVRMYALTLPFGHNFWVPGFPQHIVLIISDCCSSNRWNPKNFKLFPEIFISEIQVLTRTITLEFMNYDMMTPYDSSFLLLTLLSICIWYPTWNYFIPMPFSTWKVQDHKAWIIKIIEFTVVLLFMPHTRTPDGPKNRPEYGETTTHLILTPAQAC